MAIGLAAQSTLLSTASMLEAYEDEDPRIAGLASKTRQLVDSVDDERAANRLVNQSPDAPDALRKAESDYLRRVSPAAADAFEAGHAW